MAFVSYHGGFKNSNWYYPVGLLAAIGVNAVWLWVAKIEQDPSKLILKGLYWDSMLTLAYLIVPLIIFSVRLSVLQGAGLVLIVCGLTLIKL